MTLVLVTVGTTKFDALVNAVVSREFLDVVTKQSCWDKPIRFVVQHGGSAVQQVNTHHPTVFQDETFQMFKHGSVEVLLRPYISNLVSWIDHAELVVTHADLMDDHQRELAEILSEENYVTIGEVAYVTSILTV